MSTIRSSLYWSSRSRRCAARNRSRPCRRASKAWRGDGSRPCCGQSDNVAIVLLRVVGVVPADIEPAPTIGLMPACGPPDELEGAHHVAAIGDGQCGHSELGRLGRQHLHAEVACAPNWLWTCRWLNGMDSSATASTAGAGPGCGGATPWSGLVEVGGLQLRRFVAHAFPVGNPSRWMTPRWTRAKSTWPSHPRRRPRHGRRRSLPRRASRAIRSGSAT